MAEPSRSDPVKYLSNVSRTIASSASRREDFCWLNTLQQEMRSATLCPALHVGHDARDAENSEPKVTLSAVRVNALVDLQPLYSFDLEPSPVLPAPVPDCCEKV
jgi:hypothetical protein